MLMISVRQCALSYKVLKCVLIMFIDFIYVETTKTFSLLVHK